MFFRKKRPLLFSLKSATVVDEVLPFTGKFRRFLPKGLPPLSEQEIIDAQQTLCSIRAANLSVKTGKTYL
jgi:hypothetical protein